jgi:hypothetical protein
MLVARAMNEREMGTARVSDFCALLNCDRVAADQPMPLTHEKLSDHCPVVLDLVDQDRDPSPDGLGPGLRCGDFSSQRR